MKFNNLEFYPYFAIFAAHLFTHPLKFLSLRGPIIEMKKIFYTLSLLLAAVVVFVSCDEAETGIVFEGSATTDIPRWRSDVSASDQAVISELLGNMVLVEACHFRMGAQSQSIKYANYMSGFVNRDTVWYVAENNTAYQYVWKTQDTLWHNPANYAFTDTLRNKHGKFPYALIYKNANGYKVGPVVETSMPDYFIGKYEITQGEWMAVMHRQPKGNYCILESLSGTAPWYAEIGKGNRVAAYNIWYEDAVAFCDTLSAKTGMQFRLPTEAEWECAARGGKYSHGYKYAGSDTPSEVGWLASNARAQGLGKEDYGIHTVGELLANELGIYDMTGNVAEWVANGYYPYSLQANSNPQGKAVAGDGCDTLVLRGGSWMMEKTLDFCVANRKHSIVSSYSSEQSRQSAFVNCGFRIALSK